MRQNKNKSKKKNFFLIFSENQFLMKAKEHHKTCFTLY